MFIEIRRHMFSLIGFAGFNPGPIQSGARENLGVQAARISVRASIIGVIRTLIMKSSNGSVDKSGIDQRAIRSDANQNVGFTNLCRLVVTIQDVIFGATKTTDSQTL